MAVEQRGPAVGNDSNKKEGKGDMTKTPISLQDLRRSLYVKAKAEATWRFWGLYVHVCKMETLQEAYQMAKSNDGAPGIDGVTFEVIEESGVESFLKQIQDELVHDTYQSMRVRKKEIPKDGGTKVRVLSIPAIRDRVVQNAGGGDSHHAARKIYPCAIPRFADDMVILIDSIRGMTGS
jgi:RNA-directed DNA polymerase